MMHRSVSCLGELGHIVNCGVFYLPCIRSVKEGGGYAAIFKLLGNMSAQSGGISIFEAHVFSG